MTELHDIEPQPVYREDGMQTGITRVTQEAKAINALNAAVRELQRWRDTAPHFIAPEHYEKRYTVAELRKLEREWEERHVLDKRTPITNTLTFLDWLIRDQ